MDTNMKGRILFFKKSIKYGIAFQLSVYIIKLLCGYLLSGMLVYAMEGQAGKTSHTAVWILGILMISAIPLYLLNRYYNRAMARDGQLFRESLYQAVLDRRLLMLSRGEMEVKMRRDTEVITTFYTKTCPNAVGGAVILAGSALLIGLIDWRIGILFLALDFIQLLPIFVYEKWMRRIHNATCDAEEEGSAWTLEGYGGAHVLKSYGVRDWYLERFYRLEREVMRWGYRAEEALAIENAVFKVIDSLLQYGSYVILGLLLLYGWGKVEQVPLLIILTGYLFSSISSVFTLWIQWIQCKEATKRLNLSKPEAGEDGGSPEIESCERGVLLSCAGIDKAFGDKQILRGVSLTIRDKERVLLKGQNGSGKSTLLRILLGMEKPDRGQVDHHLGIDRISYGLQEEAQTTLTMQELVKQLGQTPAVDGAALGRHLEAFHMSECMEQQMTQLSGGQLKRFFLAAALAKRSDLLILDEPTNHLDTDSVRYLMTQLELYPGAMLICTHAEWPAFSWDRIVEMQGGILYER